MNEQTFEGITEPQASDESKAPTSTPTPTAPPNGNLNETQENAQNPQNANSGPAAQQTSASSAASSSSVPQDTHPTPATQGGNYTINNYRSKIPSLDQVALPFYQAHPPDFLTIISDWDGKHAHLSVIKARNVNANKISLRTDPNKLLASLFPDTLPQYAFQLDGANKYSRYEIHRGHLKKNHEIVLVEAGPYRGDFRRMLPLKYQERVEIDNLKDKTSIKVISNIGHAPLELMVPQCWSKSGLISAFQKVLSTQFPILNNNPGLPYSRLPVKPDGMIWENYEFNDKDWKKVVRETVMLPDGKRAMPAFENAYHTEDGLSRRFTYEIARRTRMQLISPVANDKSFQCRVLAREIQNMITKLSFPAPRLLAYKAKMMTEKNTGRSALVCWLENKNPSIPMDRTLLSIDPIATADFKTHYQFFGGSLGFVQGNDGIFRSRPLSKETSARLGMKTYPWFNGSRDSLVIDADTVALLHEHNVGFQFQRVSNVILQEPKGDAAMIWDFCCRNFPLMTSLYLTMSPTSLTVESPVDIQASHYQFRFQTLLEENDTPLKRIIQERADPAKLLECISKIAVFGREIHARPHPSLLQSGLTFSLDLVDPVWFIDNHYSAMPTKREYVIPTDQKISHIGTSFFREIPNHGVEAYTRLMNDSDKAKIAQLPPSERDRNTAFACGGIRRIRGRFLEKWYDCDHNGFLFL